MSCCKFHPEQPPQVLTRRQMLMKAGCGFGAWALLDLLTRDGLAEKVGPATNLNSVNPLAAKVSHFPARAKHVIFLFMQGGPSQVDTFDPKPMLNKLHGQPLPPSLIKGLTLQFTHMDARVLRSPQTFSRCGESGIDIADTYPNLQQCADDLAILRSCYHESFNHAPAQYLTNTGSARMGRPSLGSWVTYGLGSESENLPAFVVMQTTGDVKGGPPVYGRGFLPGTYQPTILRNTGSPVLYLDPPDHQDVSDQRRILDMSQWLNQQHMLARGEDVDDLSSRIASYELAFRMQCAVPEAVDLSRESEATKEMYGLNDKTSARFGADCLIARRLVERGVRFVQIFTGSAGGDDWDGAHAENDKVHRAMAHRTDKPIAGLLKDLRQRGLLDETLTASPPGLPGAASRAGRSTAQPTKSASAPSTTRSTSTTCTPPSSAFWASTTASSPSSSRAAKCASPTSAATTTLPKNSSGEVSSHKNVALVTPPKSATFCDIRDIWSTPFYQAPSTRLSLSP
jgi:hypothetical protein